MGQFARRQFLLGTGALLFAPRGTNAQSESKVRRIGNLSLVDSKSAAPLDRIFIDVLRQRGWVEGTNVRIDFRRTAGHLDQFMDVAKEFARTPVDVIVTSNNFEVGIVRQVTTTIPIVMLIGADPVGAGFAKSVAKPGGNVTGLTFDPTPEILGKHLQLLKEIAPASVRVIAIRNPSLPGGAAYWDAASKAARELGLTLDSLTVRGADDVAPALSALSRAERGSAVFVFGDPVTYSRAGEIAEVSLKNQLPVVSVLREYAVNGGLASYGPSFPDLVRSAAVYVDKILRGAKPGDLPFEQPAKFELIINLKTANSLGLTVPPAVLLRADQVIE